MENYAVEMIDITKAFPGVLANDRVRLAVRQGEVHAVLGENGAGKSTLMSVLYGLYEADSGSIRIRGHDARIRNPNDAAELGIGMVFQHFKLVRDYTVTENIILGSEPRTRFGHVDLAGAERRVAGLSATYGLAVDPRSRIEDLGVGAQQRVEILKTLYREADILILDEPTAVLTPQEVDELMAVIARLKSEGKTVILITHKLREIKAAADRCTVLRRGKTVGTVDVAAAREEDLAEMMVGRAVNFKVDKEPANPGRPVLEIEGLTVRGSRGNDAVRGLSLTVSAGEIVGLAGVDGNGQSELVRALAGLDKPTAGTIRLNGRDITHASVRERIEQGMAHVPEDRHRHGLVLGMRLDENLALKTFHKAPFSNRCGALDFKAIAANADRLIAQFDVRAGKGPATKTEDMSGGNQQKAIIARELDLSPDLLVVAQPTRGLDVGAIEYIHERIVAERDKGRAVLLVSFELDEVMALCDRIAAISRGSIVGEVAAADADERFVGAMMAGVQPEEYRTTSGKRTARG
ncbi:MAG: ABC transporter ATP-binding protein [Spirochaetales bacterium]|nr:MAG: ABC transporter ATP-binding protein [Spirochaetales bacterium]